MAGYATQARLDGARPRLALIGAHPLASGSRTGVGSDERASMSDHVELVGRPVDERIADWLASIGESWSQLTFFLFDPDSWR